MCTVTLIPTNNLDFILTSNRDESPKRITLPPNFYRHGDVNLLYPKDELAGGTWIGASNNNRALCLLNGAFICHKRKESYRLSRGVVVKDLLIAEDVIDAIKNYNFLDIEPFTLIVIDWNTTLEFHELIWDGTHKHFSKLPIKPYIWSSSTLYSNEMKSQRMEWFEDFKLTHKLNSENLLRFHDSTEFENKEFGIVMDRGHVKTTSITQIKKTESCLQMHFYNLNSKEQFSKSFNCLEFIND